MYERILLAYDGSVQGRAALREGALLARRLGAEVFLLSVIVEDAGHRLAQGAGATDMASQDESYRSVLEEGCSRLKRLGFDPRGKLVVGDPAVEIGTYARQIGADLVVVGHQRQSAFARWWSGPGGAYLIDHIDCSMLVSQNVISDSAFAAELVPPEPEAAPRAEACSPPGPDTSRPATRGKLRLTLLAVLPIAAIIGIGVYVTGGRVISTDDAYINADKVPVSTDVAGIVSSVAVTENQHVERGQLLYTLEELPFRLALQRAQAQLGVVTNSLNALKSNYGDAQEQVEQARNDLDYYLTEYRRQRDLLKSHVASQTSVDTALRNLRNARKRLASTLACAAPSAVPPWPCSRRRPRTTSKPCSGPSNRWPTLSRPSAMMRICYAPNSAPSM